MSNNNYNKGPFESTLDRIQKRLPKEYKKPTLKDKAVRKPNAVPPKTRTIKMRDGGIAIKKRPENMAERIERTIYKYEGTIPKPSNYDDKSIVDQEKWNSMSGLEKKTPVIQRPKKFDNMDPTTYPMNQKKTLSDWEAVLHSAKTNPRDPNTIQTKRMLRKIYNKNPKQLQDDELRIIKKHPSQMKKEVEKPIINTEPIVPYNYKPFTPTEDKRDVRQILKNSSRMRPGLSEDLIGLQSAINKNVNYVLGKKEESTESDEKSINNKEETYD
jgi:hypothetical protein|tara:strand:+ start:722 stop:1534 length:813 start_codon:yes stop_codon:yes gene_type:complete